MVFCTVFVHAKPIEVSVSPETGKVNTGSSVEFTVVVTNNQGVSDDVGVAVAGDLVHWTSLSKQVFTMPANSNEKIILTLAPSAAAPGGTFTLTVSASSVISNDRWDSKSITAEVFQRSGGLKGVHSQPPTPSPVPPAPPQPQGKFGLNLYYEPQLVTDRGFNLKDGDQCCVGDSIRVKTTGSGEFFGKGGGTDTPPIVFVDNLDETILEIERGTYIPKTYRVPVCTYFLRCLSWHPGYDPTHYSCKCLVDAAVICSSPCRSSNFGNIEETSENSFKVTGDGMVEVYTTCMARCIFYRSSGEYDFVDMAGPESAWYYGDPGDQSKADISERFFINAVKGTRGPDLVVRKYTYNEMEGKTLILVEIENLGDMKALLDKVYLNIPDYTLLYQPQSVAPGEVTEIIVEANVVDTVGLKATVEYSSEKLGCSKTKDFKGTFAIGGCNTNADCDDGDSCTLDSCNNPGADNSHCSNTAYCGGTDGNCGCTSCEDCDSYDWHSECSWSCLDSSTRYCTRTMKDYYCSGVSCEFTTLDDSYTMDCASGEVCDNGVCTVGCDISDGSWEEIPTLPGCGVRDTNSDGYYDRACCNGVISDISMKK